MIAMKMTADLLDKVEAGLAEAVESWAKERAEVVRLRALIKSSEWVSSCCYDQFCPWCGDPQSYEQKSAGHKPDCPAFNTDGTVR